MQKIAISITPQYRKILQYLNINIDIWLGNGIIAQPWMVQYLEAVNYHMKSESFGPCVNGKFPMAYHSRKFQSSITT